MSLLENKALPTTVCALDEKTVIEAPIYEKDGHIYCNGEHENSSYFCDYWGEFRGNISYVSEQLENWAKENFGDSAYWEWENPGLLVLVID
jgi:hypothetical protein